MEGVGRLMSNENGTHACPDCGAEMVELWHMQLGYGWYCQADACKEKLSAGLAEEKRQKDAATLIDNPGEILEPINIPRKYWHVSFDTFTGGDKYKESLLRAIKTPSASLYFYGKCGCGKTHLAVSILRELCVSKNNPGERYYFKSIPELLFDIRNSFREGSEEGEGDIIKKYLSYRFLVLDDLGAEKSSDFSIATLYLIINGRQNKEKPTIVTSNLTIDQIENQVDARLASRFSEYKYYFINMPDYRKGKRA